MNSGIPGQRVLGSGAFWSQDYEPWDSGRSEIFSRFFNFSDDGYGCHTIKIVSQSGFTYLAPARFSLDKICLLPRVSVSWLPGTLIAGHISITCWGVCKAPQTPIYYGFCVIGACYHRPLIFHPGNKNPNKFVAKICLNFVLNVSKCIAILDLAERA